MFRLLRNADAASTARFQVGMKLEAVDPLNLSLIAVATVKKVLRNNYLMVGIGKMREEEEEEEEKKEKEKNMLCSSRHCSPKLGLDGFCLVFSWG